MNKKILCVDDDPRVVTTYQRNLGDQFEIDTALGGAEALKLLAEKGPYAVVVADMQMPQMNGVQLLTLVQEKSPDTVRIMLTGNADQQTAVDAVNQGHVYRFLNKPCPPDMLALALDAGVKQYHAVVAERDLLENTLNGSVRMLAEILSVVDPNSFGRGQVLTDTMRAFFATLGSPFNWECEVAALLSHVGYVTVPASLLQRARAGNGLTGPEQDILTRIPATGSDLLAKIPRLEGVARSILYQNKNFDGTGFPGDAVAGEDIPVTSRILKVLSDLHELESKGVARGEALLLMQRRKGLYDPQVLDAAFKCFDVYLPESSRVKHEPHAVNLAGLLPGQILLSNIETREGLLIVPGGIRLTPVMLEKIRNFAKLNVLTEPVWVSE